MNPSQLRETTMDPNTKGSSPYRAASRQFDPNQKDVDAAMKRVF
jgi:hypothetical protein